MLNSNYRPLCAVALPYQGRRHYMHSFDLAAPKMRDGFEVATRNRQPWDLRCRPCDKDKCAKDFVRRRPSPHAIPLSRFERVRALELL